MFSVLQNRVHSAWVVVPEYALVLYDICFGYTAVSFFASSRILLALPVGHVHWLPELAFIVNIFIVIIAINKSLEV